MMSPYPRSIPVFGTLTHMGGSIKVLSPPIPPGNSQIVQVKRSSPGVGVLGRTAPAPATVENSGRVICKPHTGQAHLQPSIPGLEHGEQTCMQV